MNPEPFEAQILKTPFHSRTAALCRTNDWGDWAGYTTVNVYSNVEREYFAVRNSATLFDLSPMIKYAITGPHAARFLNKLLTRDIDKLKPGRVAYAVWCNDDGMVIDDGTVFRMSDTDFRLCSQERHLPWLLDTAIGYQVAIEDVTDAVAGLALQGPTSCAVLKSLGLDGVENLKPYALTEFDLDGDVLAVSRTGFTGDLGYELWIDPTAAGRLWDRLTAAGRLHGIVPIGSAALEMARIEAGFIQANVDFVAGDLATRPDRLRSPFELDLDWLVDLNKGHFVGRRALLRERQTGSRHALVGLDIDGNKPAESAFIYSGKDTEVGVITSAMWSPSAKRNIAIASLKRPYEQPGHTLWADTYIQRELKWDRIAASCRITDKRFYNPPRRWATPAADS